MLFELQLWRATPIAHTAGMGGGWQAQRTPGSFDMLGVELLRCTRVRRCALHDLSTV